MKKKGLATITSVLLMSASMAAVSYAGGWKQDAVGRWWQNDDGSYPVSKWEWLDDNDGDGLSECYYFNENGYCLTSTTTPDGYTVNENGAWTVNGVIQAKPSFSSAGDISNLTGSENGYLFDIWALAGGYGSDVMPSSLMSINIYSSPDPESNIIGNCSITVPSASTEYRGELRRESDRTFSFVLNGGVYARIEVTDGTFGAVAIHYIGDGFECNYRMYEAYPLP